MWDYEPPAEKTPHRLIFTSVPDRGLGIVAETFPRIKEQVPDASLVITSDYRLWGAISPTNDRYIQMFMRMKDVEFLGAVPRERLVQEQLKAQIHYYPCLYEELFCIAVAESMVAGVLPITTPMGALQTTNMGVIIDGNPNEQVTRQRFVQTTIEYLHSHNLSSIREDLKNRARERFLLEAIMKQWDEKVFNV